MTFIICYSFEFLARNSNRISRYLRKLTTENIISEIAEREIRRNIIFNVPELESGVKNGQLASDKESIEFLELQIAQI